MEKMERNTVKRDRVKREKYRKKDRRKKPKERQKKGKLFTETNPDLNFFQLELMIFFLYCF